MKFGPVATETAGGAVLAHTLRTGDKVFKKGRILDGAALDALRAGGYATIIVARLEAGDVPEDEAAARIAHAVAGSGVEIGKEFTGRCNLFAAARGLATVDAGKVQALNRVDETATIATVAPFTRVEPGEMVATVKIIPFAAPEAVVHACSAIGTLIAVAPLVRREVGLVLTRLPHLSERLLDGPSQGLRGRMAALGGTVAREIRCAHDEAAVTVAIGELLDAGCSPVLLLGASAVTDRADVIPAAIVRAGGVVEHLGMPVDPGNLMVLGRHGATAILGVPGCARSPRLSGFDWVLERICADLPVSSTDISAMGVGGLLKENPSRPQPRGGMPAVAPPVIAAVVLAAGSSRRMGENKLLVAVEGTPMVARAVDAARASRAARVVVVTGHQADAVRAVLAGRAVEIVHNPEHDQGMASSLRAGLAAVGAVDGMVVCLGDMPWVSAAVIDQLIAAFDPGAGRDIVVPHHHGKRGNPVLWGARHFPEMARLGGDSGARSLLEANADSAVIVEIEDAGVLLDVDTREALVRKA